MPNERYHQAICTPYAVGDKVSMPVRRTWLEIWHERIVTRRWHVERTKRLWFVCTNTSAGSLWPQVLD